ncbi:flagellar motor switch protein FliG [Acuticoccus sp. MNP-M23]|uniref:flagellar motor switch protein FliG n=1 Tax=Acuticoccus sp. MNP-M23 TaxID=3072793 RepID=UPI002816919B|nr:flagellar motor switch protein FliG [Acuticoccus sp. MNP-M23]WMS41800.1 flagellar motor switch protein FliG [Acuticoccus sp. MNP-M23]
MVPATAVRPRVLSTREKVATLLMTMSKDSAGRVMKFLPPDDIKAVTHTMAELKPVPLSQIEEVVDEFVEQFGVGTTLTGDADSVRALLSGIVPEGQLAEIIAEMEGRVNESIWDRLSGISETALTPYLLNEHPQTTALCLSKLNPISAARVMSEMPKELRDNVARRMLTCKAVVDDALKLVEVTLHEDFMVNLSLKMGGDSHARMAEIINKMELDQMENVLEGITQTHPKSAEILRSLLFTFDDIVKLDVRSLTTLFDAIDSDQLVMALKGTDAGFRNKVLSSLASRTRRMVEQELASGDPATQRDVNEARRKITDLALSMGQRGEIDLSTGDEGGELVQ